MITIERTTDMELVRAIVTDPQVYRDTVVPDSSPIRENWWAPSGYLYLIARKDEVPVGVVALHDGGTGNWFAHLAFLPAAWGRTTLKACQKVIDWMKTNTDCWLLLATIPSFNRSAIALVDRLGFDFVWETKGDCSNRGVPGDSKLFMLKV